MPVRALEVEHVVGNGTLLEGETDTFRSALGIGEAGGERGAYELIARPSSHPAHGLVDVDDRHRFVHRDQAVYGRLDQAAVISSLLGELGLQLRLFCDVAHAGENSVHDPGLVREDCRVEGNENRAPVTLLQCEIVVGDGALVEGQSHAFSGPPGINKVVGKCRSDRVDARITGHLAHGLIDVRDVEHRIHRDQTVQRSFNQVAVVSPLFCPLGLELGLFRNVAGRGKHTLEASGGIAAVGDDGVIRRCLQHVGHGIDRVLRLSNQGAIKEYGGQSLPSRSDMRRGMAGRYSGVNWILS